MIKQKFDSFRVRLRLYKVSLHSVSLLWLGSICGALLAFTTQIFLARVLGVKGFGEFSSALVMVMLVAPLAGFGVSGYWLSVFGREGWGGRRWISASLWFLVLSTGITVTIILLWAWIGVHDSNSSWLLTILALQVVGQAILELAGAKFQLEERYARLAVWQLFPHFLRFICVVIFISCLGKDYVSTGHAAAAYSIATIFIFLVGGYQVLLVAMGKIALKGHGDEVAENKSVKQNRPSFREVMAGAWPFGLAGFFYLVYFQSDIVLIRYLVGEGAAGLYNSAFVVMTAIYLFPSVIYQKFLLPALHRWAHHDVAGLQKVYRAGNFWMLISGLGVMVMVWLVSPGLFPMLFGYEYVEAVPLLMILAFAIPFRFLASSAGAMLVTKDNMRVKVRLMGAGALINVSLNLVFIPYYGPVGSAVATVITEAISMILYFFYVHRLNLFHQAKC